MDIVYSAVMIICACFGTVTPVVIFFAKKRNNEQEKLMHTLLSFQKVITDIKMEIERLRMELIEKTDKLRLELTTSIADINNRVTRLESRFEDLLERFEKLESKIS